MRKRTAFFSVAIAAVAVLLAGTVVRGGGPQSASAAAVVVASPPPLTSCRVGDYLFTVSSGPSFVSCDSGECTEIEYKVSPTPEVAFALEGKGIVSVSNDGTFFDPCVGIGSFGKGSCHEQAVRAFPDDSGKFKITLAGQRRPSPTSVAIGTTDASQACEILGLGLENGPNPDQTAQLSETVNFKGCVVEFTRDPRTGDVLQAQLTEDSPKNCTSPFRDGRVLTPQPVQSLKLTLPDGSSLGNGKFGDGYISSGGESCTTRVIGGKVYTWGTAPCP